jgi:tetratricopeptide (TPR) repeat protein
MTDEQRMQRELRPVRARHDDPELPDDVSASDLDRVARNELKTLTKDNAEWVAKHLAMAARLIESDPELAHKHVISAARRAGRIAVVRESLAITAYATGDYALALRELRTYRRISGSNDQLPLMVDSERGVGRADRALELGRSVDRATLPASVQAALAIAMSGARLDLGQAEEALGELQIPQLDPNTAFSYSPELFSAYASVLEELGREDEAAQWHERASRADLALGGSGNSDETVEIIELDDDQGAADEIAPVDGVSEADEPSTQGNSSPSRVTDAAARDEDAADEGTDEGTAADAGVVARQEKKGNDVPEA